MIAAHVVLSLIGIASGLIVVAGMIRASRPGGWTACFLATTLLTSATGFVLPHDHLLPADVVGIVSLVVLAMALVALYAARLAGPWRWIYVVTATLALYLNALVGVVQAFQKLPVLSRLAPTQSEPPFVAAQLAVLAIFVALGILAVRRFRPAPTRTA